MIGDEGFLVAEMRGKRRVHQLERRHQVRLRAETIRLPASVRLPDGGQPLGDVGVLSAHLLDVQRAGGAALGHAIPEREVFAVMA
ncbi:hypothetical protein GCM10027033_23150 [Leucobacter ruminantium]